MKEKGFKNEFPSFLYGEFFEKLGCTSLLKIL
jgi:hypothetical protein